MKRVLITGGMGYLGSRLAVHLRDKYDLLLGTRRAPLSQPDWARGLKVVTTDFNNPRQLAEVCEGVNSVVHLAGANEVDAADDPVGVISGTVRDTCHLMQALPKGARIVLLSTTHVYGSPLAGTINEEVIPRPRHYYAMARRAAEDLVLYGRGGELEALVLRLSNGIGAPVHSQHTRWKLIGNDLCRQAVTTEILELKSSGHQLRDFIPMRDVLRAIDHGIQLSRDRLADGIFNVGGERAMSVRDMAQFVAGRCEVVLGFRPEIVGPKVTPEAPVKPLHYEIKKWRATGFELETPLEEEIDATLRFCLSQATEVGA